MSTDLYWVRAETPQTLTPNISYATPSFDKAERVAFNWADQYLDRNVTITTPAGSRLQVYRCANYDGATWLVQIS